MGPTLLLCCSLPLVLFVGSSRPAGNVLRRDATDSPSLDRQAAEADGFLDVGHVRERAPAGQREPVGRAEALVQLSPPRRWCEGEACGGFEAKPRNNLRLSVLALSLLFVGATVLMGYTVYRAQRASPTGREAPTASRSRGSGVWDAGASDQRQTGFWGTVLSIVLCGLCQGPSFLGLPYAARGASLLPSIAVLGLSLLATHVMIMILVEVSDKHRVYDLAGLMALIPGRRAGFFQLACNLVVYAAMVLGIVGYLSVMADEGRLLLSMSRAPKFAWMGMASQELESNRFVDQEFPGAPVDRAIDRLPYVMAAFAVCGLVFLFGKDHMRFSSFAGILAFVYILWVLFAEAHGNMNLRPQIGPPPCMYQLSWSIADMMLYCFLSVSVHFFAVPVYAQLEDRSPEKFSRVLTVAFCVLFLLFSAFIVAGNLAFEQATLRPDILVNVPWHTFAGWTSRSVMVASTPFLILVMLKNLVQPLRATPTGEQYASWFALFVLLVCALVSLRTTMLGSILIAAGCNLSFVGFVPPAVGYFVDSRDGTKMALLCIPGIFTILSWFLVLVGLGRREIFQYTSDCAFPMW